MKRIIGFVLMLALLFSMGLLTGCDEGLTGKSAYEIAVDNGFSGTVQEWLDSLQGQSGKDGSAWFEGVGKPKSSLGQDNDYYFDSAAMDMYKKANGAWTAFTTLNPNVVKDGYYYHLKADSKIKVDTGKSLVTFENLDGIFDESIDLFSATATYQSHGKVASPDSYMTTRFSAFTDDIDSYIDFSVDSVSCRVAYDSVAQKIYLTQALSSNSDGYVCFVKTDGTTGIDGNYSLVLTEVRVSEQTASLFDYFNDLGFGKTAHIDFDVQSVCKFENAAAFRQEVFDTVTVSHVLSIKLTSGSMYFTIGYRLSTHSVVFGLSYFGKPDEFLSLTMLD